MIATYNQTDTWRQYEPFFPASLRLRELPTEESWSWRDCSVHLDRHVQVDAPATVVLLHGAGGYGRMLAPLATMLHSAGYEVVAPDLPGYGLTVAPPQRFSYRQWADCAAELVTAEVLRGRRPVVTFGLSLGGYLAYQAAAKSRLASGVIATTLCDPRLPLVRQQFAGSKLLSLIAPIMAPMLDTLLGRVRLPIRWVCNMKTIANDPGLIALVNADPLGGGIHAPVRFLRSVLDVEPVIEPDQFDVCPVLFAQPMADRWTTLEASKPFFDRIKGPKELVLLENCGHFPLEEPGVSRLRKAMLEFLARVAK